MLKTFLIFLLFLGNHLLGQNYNYLLNKLAIHFNGRYGQVEIGGNFIGAEFHHSRPLPSRISFYYPVANSIDLSTDYWKRDESQAFRIQLNLDGQIEELGKESWDYRYTPFYATFEKVDSSFHKSITYHFCKDFPAMVVEIRIKNLEKKQKKAELSTLLNTSLRTCHTYAIRNKAHLFYLKNESIVITEFDQTDTDSTWIFVANVGELPLSQNEKTKAPYSVENPTVSFRFQKVLKPNEELVITQLIGSCRMREASVLIEKLTREWQENYQLYEQSILNKVFETASFQITDSTFLQTLYWSKAMLGSNKHYLDEHIVPMPCPAEYNFFFTHDLLLTDLGGVLFDQERVKNDLLYLRSLAKADSVLPHAYYWKDGHYQTEFCGSDNWNHLWFIMLAGSYLRHTNDKETLIKLFPIIKKSVKMQLQNKGDDDLMYAMRPDWWDIGDVYGARAYTTSLMIRALREYAYICLQLNIDTKILNDYLMLSKQMQQRLVKYLWDNEDGFLINMLNEKELDHHFYAGSLIAAALKILDPEKISSLLETAQKKLLDQNIGIRIVMPADFHQLIDQYKFHGMEMGEPYQYINGGVWPQGIVWYALGWLSINQPDSAESILKRYYTLDGIKNSPNGQPSFFEYRNADVKLPSYGKIDKPTFLWAGGWYLYSLYHLAGIRENEWNIAFDPNIPKGWDDIKYDVLIYGSLTKVYYKGRGNYFKNIQVDRVNSVSAVFNSRIKEVIFERGIPETPYIANANCLVKKVNYDQMKKSLSMEVEGLINQNVILKIVSPFEPQKENYKTPEAQSILNVHRIDNVWIIEYFQTLIHPKEIIAIQF